MPLQQHIPSIAGRCVGGALEYPAKSQQTYHLAWWEGLTQPKTTGSLTQGTSGSHASVLDRPAAIHPEFVPGGSARRLQKECL